MTKKNGYTNQHWWISLRLLVLPKRKVMYWIVTSSPAAMSTYAADDWECDGEDDNKWERANSLFCGLVTLIVTQKLILHFHPIPSFKSQFFFSLQIWANLCSKLQFVVRHYDIPADTKLNTNYNVPADTELNTNYNMYLNKYKLQHTCGYRVKYK